VPEPLKTTQAPISNAQLYQPPIQLAQPMSAAPQITGPQYPTLSRPLFAKVPMGGLQNGYHHEEENAPLPMSLTPKPQPLPNKTRHSTN
jgi:hypothetical protein